jgi:SAM-dependent methyltransferase
LLKFLKIQRGKKKLKRVRSDAQLKLYSEMLSGDFLHYGYFENPDIKPEDVSLNDIERAQFAYAKLFLEKITDRSSPILDIGCGMGGLSNMLSNANLTPVALTPDINQFKYIEKKYPYIELIRGKFEELDVDRYKDYFGTVITSESLQYLKLDGSLDIINKILKKKGEWLVCDYFRKNTSFEKSGHYWDTFLTKIRERGFVIIYEKDITANVLVTLKFVHMLSRRIGIPVMRFTLEKFKSKQPGFFYLMEDVANKLKDTANDGMESVNPERFEKEKKYMFLVIKRQEDI